MRKLLLALLLLPFSALGQCDLELLGFDTTTGDITIVVNNSENCGCNEFTSIGTSCTGDTEDNEVVHHLNLGINFDNTLPMPECAEAVEYHPGWRFLNFTFIFHDDLPDDGAVTGDTLNFNIIPDNVGLFDSWTCWQEYLTTDLGPDECIEFVIWQINYSQTNTENQGAPSLGGYPWQDTCGTCAFQTQNYPDIDNSDNFFYWCGDELPPPPIYVYPGCTDLSALNYDPNATEDDGSCEYPVVEGCNDPVACNYDVNVTEPGGLCVYCYSPYELGDSLCNQTSGYWDWYLGIFPNCIGGCTDPEASNYNEDATGDDGSCVYDECPTDTIYITETEFIYDTTYITLPPDTVTVIEYITQYDTITVTETEFIFVTDTIVEVEYITLIDTTYVLYTDTVYVYEFVEIDCETGLPCSEIRSEECNVYIPNAFTPDNDGYNDAWEIVLDSECWTDVKAKVVSRWGNIVWQSEDPNNLIWDGSFNGGDYYVQNEIYMWLFQARKVGTTEIKDLKGHVTVIR